MNCGILRSPYNAVMQFVRERYSIDLISNSVAIWIMIRKIRDFIVRDNPVIVLVIQTMVKLEKINDFFL